MKHLQLLLLLTFTTSAIAFAGKKFPAQQKVAIHPEKTHDYNCDATVTITNTVDYYCDWTQSFYLYHL